MPLPIARWAFLALALLTALSHVDSVKFGGKAPAGKTGKRQVKVSFDDDSFSFWDPFKSTGFNITAAVVPIAEEVGRRGPGYLAYAAASTGLGLFLPPKVLTAANVAYVAAAVARSHDSGVETFCRDEGRLLLGMPSLHLAAAGSCLRVLRFRLWRRLFVRATLFRLRYQLRFMRIYRPRWVTKGLSPLALIVQDTAHAARSVQGLLPDLCHQAAFFAAGCRLPYWADCSPPPRLEKGWGAFRRLDRRLKREFGGRRAALVRSRDTPAPGPGLPGWRSSRGIVLGTAGAFSQSLAGRGASGGRASKKNSTLRRSRRVRGGQAKKASSATRQLLSAIEGDQDDDGVVAEELLEEYAAVLYAGSGEEERESAPARAPRAAGRAPSSSATPPKKKKETPPKPAKSNAKGPLVRFHNVTTVASRGSTLTKSYRALAELPYGDGTPDGDSSFFSRPRSAPAWAAADPEDEDGGTPLPLVPAPAPAPEPPLVLRPSALQPVVIKRTVRRQLRLAEDDVATARKVLRRLTFDAEIDLDLAGVLSEVAAAVARAGDLRSEAERIEKVRSNLARAGMLGSAVGVPEVVSCPELGPLARKGVLVTTALRGVDVSDTYVMQHAAPGGEKERSRFVDVVFKAFAQMCLADGCFPSNPMPENLLYMYSGQVGLTDLSSVSELDDTQRRALCRLYRALAELKGVDASNPSEAAELKARAAMEGVGLVIDLPPAGGVPWSSSPLTSSSSSSVSDGLSAEESATLALATAAESAIDATFGAEPPVGDEDGEEEMVAAAAAAATATPPPSRSPPSPRPPLTYVMLLRGLFDTQREEALALMGGGGGDLLKGMAVRRLPQAVAPVLRMVANLRGICNHLDVDKSVLPRFSRAASKGLSWRRAGWPEL
eukprot:g4705.t1